MGHDHSHAVTVAGNEKRLLWALGLTAAFCERGLPRGMERSVGLRWSDRRRPCHSIYRMDVGRSVGRRGHRSLGLPRTWVLLKASTHILLEGTPADVDLPKLRAAIEAMPGVIGIHLHVWTLTSGRYVLTANVVAKREQQYDFLKEVPRLLRDEYKVFHTTIQMEDEACGDLHEPVHEDSQSEAGKQSTQEHEHGDKNHPRH